MLNHPANRNRQIKAVRDAGHDPKIGSWPGDEGYGTVTGRMHHAADLGDGMDENGEYIPDETDPAQPTLEEALAELCQAYVTMAKLRQGLKTAFTALAQTANDPSNTAAILVAVDTIRPILDETKL